MLTDQDLMYVVNFLGLTIFTLIILYIYVTTYVSIALASSTLVYRCTSVSCLFPWLPTDSNKGGTTKVSILISSPLIRSLMRAMRYSIDFSEFSLKKPGIVLAYVRVHLWGKGNKKKKKIR
jgi:hypothetical protein